MKVCVFGLWHLGSVTSACLAKRGHTVTGLDFDKAIVRGLQQGRAPLWEPGLDELISENFEAGRLSFTYDAARALKDAEVIWVTFDTPVSEKDVADVAWVEKNIRKILPYLRPGTKLILSSQVPVGFTAKIRAVLAKKFPRRENYVAYAPENLRLGKALQTFLEPDRIVIGVGGEEAKAALRPLFLSIADRLEWMSLESAEMTKHAINAFLAASVCFANEVAGVCEKVGADYKEVERGLKSEARIGPKAYLGAGMAFSGGTLARDIDHLIRLSAAHQLPSPLIRAVKTSNDLHQSWVLRKCRKLLGRLKKARIALLGLTYKPGTDTLRRSAAVALAQALRSRGATVDAYDPAVKILPAALSKTIQLRESLNETLRETDLVIVATEWPEFKEMGADAVRLIRQKTVVDPNGFLLKTAGADHPRYFYVGKGGSR